jgi:hypothetical protein
MVDKNPAQLVPQRIVFESTAQGALPHDFLASEGWWANADGRGLTTTYSHEVLRGEERTGDTGAWAVSIAATGMPAEKQQQFRADIKANSKPWESEIEFTMPDELKLYRDYELTDESEVASAAGKKGGKKGGKVGGKIDPKPETKERLNYALNPENKDGYDSKWQKGGATDANPETKNANNYALDPKNKDGYDPKWQEGGKKGGATDANPETKKANNYALNPKNKDGFETKWQHRNRTNCITCKMVPRQGQSDKCNQCQLAVFFSK